MRSRVLRIVSRCLVAMSAALLGPIATGQTSTLRVVTSEASFGAPALSDDAGRVVLQAAGGSLPYSFSIKAGVLPPGLALVGSSAISGIYQAAGSWSFTLQVTDGKKRVATRDITLSVYPVPRPIPANIPFTISCPYMPRPKWPSHGTEFFLLNNERDAIKATQGQRVPLLGQYDGTNPEVIDWQVNWATGVGITNFAFNDWWMEGVEHPLYSTSLNAFLASRYGAQMTFSVQYNGGRTFTNQDAAQALFLEHALPFYATNYFTRPNYFRVDGLPVIQILNIGATFGSYDPGTIKAAIERANAVICEATKGESCGAYWMCSDIGMPTVDFSLVGSAGFNAVHPYYVTQHIWPEYTPALWNAHLRTEEERFGNADWTSYRAGYFDGALSDSRARNWAALESAIRNGMKFVPTASTDFDSRPVFWLPDHLFYRGQTPASFANYLNDMRLIAEGHLDTLPVCTNTGKPLFSVGPWNEQGESSTVEPGYSVFTPPSAAGVADPFAMLRVLARVFGVSPQFQAPASGRSFGLTYPENKSVWTFAQTSDVELWQSLGDADLSWNGQRSTMVVRGFVQQFLDADGSPLVNPVNLLTPLKTPAAPFQYVTLRMQTLSGSESASSVSFGWKGSDYSASAHEFGAPQEPGHRFYSNIAGVAFADEVPGTDLTDYTFAVGFDPSVTRWNGTLRQLTLSFAGAEGPFHVEIDRLWFH